MANQWDLTPQASKEDIEKRRLEIMKLRRIGTPWEEIADKIGKMFNRSISYQQCAEDYRIIMAARAKELHQETDAIRSEQLYRLGVAIKRVWDRIDAENPSLDHIEILIKLETRMAKLLGTDAPSKSEVDDKRKAPVQLSEAQIKSRMEFIMRRMERFGKPAVTVSAVPVVEGIVEDNTLQHITSVEALPREEPRNDEAGEE